MKKENIIRFANSKSVEDPWNRKSPQAFEDLVFRDDLKDRQLKLKDGPNWIRIIPTLADSSHWMLPVSTITMKHGRFAHPRTLGAGNQSVFDYAYRWYQKNSPQDLYNRGNPKGHRLLCDSLCAFWCLSVEEDQPVEAKLFLGSAFDGSGGRRPPGLGYRIWQMVTKTDPDVDVIADPVDRDTGALICIEKTMSPGSRYPVYHLRVGRQAAPIQDLLDKMEGPEFDAIRPVEKTIRQLNEAEQWQHLARVIGADVVSKIRTSLV